MATLQRWRVFANKLRGACEQVFDRSEERKTSLGAREPGVIALALLGRTMSNVRAVEIMLEHRLIVEARTLTRCCFENLFFATALASEGSKFVERMLEDEKQKTLAQAKRILDWAEQQEERHDFERSLQETMRQVKMQELKFEATTFRDAADAGDVRDAYLTYSHLSADAAHPSVQSLHRHMNSDADGGIYIFAAAQTNESEIANTFGMACSTLLGVYSAVSKVVNHKKAAAEVPLLVEEFNAIPDADESEKGADLG